MLAIENEKSSREEFVISHTFDAPRALVWKVWTDAKHLAQWFGPKGFTVEKSEVDLRPGGMFHYHLKGPGSEMWGRFVYREVAEPERLSFVTSFSDPQGGITRSPFGDTWPLEWLTTITFIDEGAKTRMDMRAVPVNATEEERKEFEQGHASMQGGWGGTLAVLDEYLAKTAASTEDRTITGTRVFDAPRELVWKVWTEPEHVAQWWGPNGFTNTISEMNVAPGGVWLFTMHGPDGRNYRNEISYIEVEKPSRLVYDHGPTPRFRVTVTFEEEGGKTRVTMQSLFESAETRDMVVKTFNAIEGMQQTLGRLAAYLEQAS